MSVLIVAKTEWLIDGMTDVVGVLVRGASEAVSESLMMGSMHWGRLGRGNCTQKVDADNAQTSAYKSRDVYCRYLVLDPSGVRGRHRKGGTHADRDREYYVSTITCRLCPPLRQTTLRLQCVWLD